LHVRRKLTAEELAEQLTMENDGVSMRPSRLRDSFDDGVTSTLLATRCRRNCRELDALLSELDAGRITPQIRRAVQQHARQCDRCRESKRGFVSPAEILGSFSLMSPSHGLRASLWKSIPAA